MKQNWIALKNSNSLQTSLFKEGFLSILPIASGIIPFGLVMGAAFAEANLSLLQALFMDTVLYSGAAQLATTELMKLNTAVFVVVATGLIINARFLLYSAAMSPYLENANKWVKLFCSFTLTDQSYAAMTSRKTPFVTNEDAAQFYIGTAVAMMMAWHASVIIGFLFGNIAPAALNLDYAIPLSFVALLIPTLKTKSHMLVAVFSSVASLVFYGLPLRTGLMASALLAIGLSWILIQRKKAHD